MFQKQMIKSNVNGALRLPTNNRCKGILALDDVTIYELHVKHPDVSPVYNDLLIQGPIALANQVIILRACLRTKGTAEVSGLDVEE